MKQERQYILKDGMKKQIRMMKIDDEKITNRKIAEILGISESYVSEIMNRKKTKISKLMAYAFCKTINSDFEIPDLFDIK